MCQDDCSHEWLYSTHAQTGRTRWVCTDCGMEDFKRAAPKRAAPSPAPAPAPRLAPASSSDAHAGAIRAALRAERDEWIRQYEDLLVTLKTTADELEQARAELEQVRFELEQVRFEREDWIRQYQDLADTLRTTGNELEKARSKRDRALEFVRFVSEQNCEVGRPECRPCQAKALLSDPGET